MSVHVTLRGRLGNNLFQYALGRIIAEHHGFELQCTERPLAPWQPATALQLSGPATLGALIRHFPRAPLRTPGRAVNTPIESYELTPGGTWAGQRIALESILADPRPRQIRLHGYFQRFEYFRNHVENIRQWFRVVGVVSPYSPGPTDVLVNIRRGTDFAAFAWIMPVSYYEHVLDGLSDVGRVFVCGTDVDGVVRRRLAKYRPIYYEATPIEHFAFFRSFRRIVLSNSTFAWWASFLSDAHTLYVPRARGSNAYCFTGFEDVDLDTGQSRYREVDLTAVTASAD